MTEQTQLTLEREFLRRDEFDQALYLAPLTERQIAFVRLMYLASVDTLHGIRSKRRQDSVWMIGEQSELARELHRTERSVRDIAASLEDVKRDGDGLPLFFQRRKVVKDAREITVYVLNLAELRRMTDLDADDPLDMAIIECDGQPFSRMDSACAHPELSTGKSTPSAPSSAPSSGGPSGGPSAASSGPHGHGRDLFRGKEHLNKTPDPSMPMAMGNDQGNFIFFGWGRNSNLTDELIRTIISSRNRGLWDRFDKEGLRAFKWPNSQVDRLNRASMWHHCATCPGIRSPMKTLIARMKDQDFQKSTDESDEWARQFLKSNEPTEQVAPVSLNISFGGLPDKDLPEDP